MNYKRLFLDHLDEVDRIVSTIGNRRHLSPDELGDLRGFVHLRLVEDQYAILRKFRGRSRFFTYLAVVIERLASDFFVEHWGRWRPSATAERLGPVALLLDKLITRDGHSLDEACELVRAHHGVTESDAALRRLWEQIPLRPAPGAVAADASEGNGESAADSAVDDRERQAEVEAIDQALARVLGGRTDRERLLLALRFEQDLGLHEMAAVTGSSPAALQRKLKKILGELGASLAAAGITPDQLARVVGHPKVSLAPLLRAVRKK